MRHLTVLLVDDHTLFRQAVAQGLATGGEFSILHCGSVGEAIELLRRQPVDVAMVDYDLGPETAFTFLTESKARGFAAPVLIVTAGVTIAQARMLLAHSVAGIFVKDQSLESLADAVRTVGSGATCVDPRYFAAALSRSSGEGRGNRLSPRERQVLTGILEGLSNKEIAANLGVSESTVKSTVQRIFEKMGVRTRAQLARAALERLGDFE